jgi:vacuolar-type H+-ATPase subunit H
MSKRDEVIEKLKKQLDVMNQQIDELELKAGQVSGEAREKYREQMVHLREMSQPARDKLSELKTAGEGQWDALTVEAEKVYKAFVHSVNYFKSQLK